MPLRVVRHPRIATRDEQGATNGALVPLWNVHEALLPDDRRPDQVYLTICAPGSRKGPHLHLKRWGFFTCIRGNARITVKTPDGYESVMTGDDHGYATVEVPAGWPALIENLGAMDAYVINMPTPAWRPDDQDEHPVADWEFRG